MGFWGKSNRLFTRPTLWVIIAAGLVVKRGLEVSINIF
jgi:hypothetical protein